MSTFKAIRLIFFLNIDKALSTVPGTYRHSLKLFLTESPYSVDKEISVFQCSIFNKVLFPSQNHYNHLDDKFSEYDPKYKYN